MVGRNLCDIIVNHELSPEWGSLTHQLTDTGSWSGTLTTLNKNGKLIIVDCAVFSVKQPENSGYLLIIKSSPLLSSSHDAL